LRMAALVSESKITVLVTGGTGLVGKAIETVVKENQNDNETWFFCEFQRR